MWLYLKSKYKLFLPSDKNSQLTFSPFEISRISLTIYYVHARIHAHTIVCTIDLFHVRFNPISRIIILPPRSRWTPSRNGRESELFLSFFFFFIAPLRENKGEYPWRFARWNRNCYEYRRQQRTFLEKGETSGKIYGPAKRTRLKPKNSWGNNGSKFNVHGTPGP